MAFFISYSAWKQLFFKHRFQKRQYFDLFSRHRQDSVPLVLFSASLWDQLSKILNRDLFFHNLLVFLHHSQLLTNLRAKSCQKIADLLVEIAQTPMSEFANWHFIKNCWFLRFEIKQIHVTQANSKIVDVVTVPGDEEQFGNSLEKIWKLKFGQDSEA